MIRGATALAVWWLVAVAPSLAQPDTESIAVGTCVDNARQSGYINDALQGMVWRNYCTCLVQHNPFTDSELQQIDTARQSGRPPPPWFSSRFRAATQVCCNIPGSPCHQ